MTKIIIIEKNGIIKETTVKNYDEAELYKKCGFKSPVGFEMAHAWSAKYNNVEYTLSIYGKTKGKAGSENKYELPPPLDKTLFFGACVAILKTSADNSVVNMSKTEFNKIMEFLFGGFDDIGLEDSESDDDANDEMAKLPKTKQGYAKDDFIVDDEDEDEDEEKPTKKQNKAKQEKVKKEKKVKEEKAKIVKKKPTPPEIQEMPSVLECSEELVEEPYIE